MTLIGTKNNKDLFNNLLGKLIPEDIMVYIEPFGGEFGLYEIMPIKPPIAVYNDIDIELYKQAKEKYKNNQSIYCFNKDYKEIIYELNLDRVFFYIDCPYYERYYYKYNFEKKDHIELAQILKNIKGRFLLSYQDRPLMRKLYNKYNFHKYNGTNFISKPEIAITNY
jgi:DNA adenine methylase